jgi:hypothetical protein
MYCFQFALAAAKMREGKIEWQELINDYPAIVDSTAFL